MFHDHFFTYFLFELLAHLEIVIKQLGVWKLKKLNVLIFVQLGFIYDFYNNKYHWTQIFECLFVVSQFLGWKSSFGCSFSFEQIKVF